VNIAVQVAASRASGSVEAPLGHCCIGAAPPFMHRYWAGTVIAESTRPVAGVKGRVTEPLRVSRAVPAL
jgi:hypothetical protein